ncbi:MAG: hypothetical protein COB53_12695 [Elusimicrobia bacterium]|nr:MAG: hypothetical protein COB53_12695 [Elusimicrobiota bacterium]
MKKKSDLKFLKGLKTLNALRANEYEYAGDREALATMRMLPGAGTLCQKWVTFWLEFHKAGFLGTAVQVSAKQFPEINSLRLKAAEVLDISPPPVFIIEQPIINAFTMGSGQDDAFIAITRPLLQSATEKELMFILGHEMGHIKSQHALYATVAMFLSYMGMFFGRRLVPVSVLVYPLQIALKAWFRRSEITCDRAGLTCVQDLHAARRALLLLGCCSRELADRIDLEEFCAQGEQASKTYGKWSEMLQTHPYLPKRIRCLNLFAESHFYVRCVLENKRSDFLPPEDLDDAVFRILRNGRHNAEKTSEIKDLAALQAGLAFAGAWADDQMTAAKQKSLEALLKRLPLHKNAVTKLKEYLKEPYSDHRAFRELRYFSGSPLKALPYAFSLLISHAHGILPRQKLLLLRLCKASGLDKDTAESVVFDVAERKNVFKERCGTDICARCAVLFKIGSKKCPSCGTPAGSGIEPKHFNIKPFSEELEEIRGTVAEIANKTGGELVRDLVGAIHTYAEVIEAYAVNGTMEESIAEKKKRRRKHGKRFRN